MKGFISGGISRFALPRHLLFKLLASLLHNGHPFGVVFVVRVKCLEQFQVVPRRGPAVGFNGSHPVQGLTWKDWGSVPLPCPLRPGFTPRCPPPRPAVWLWQCLQL